MRSFNNVLVTGGAGFIGVNLIRYVLEQSGFSGTLINYDKLTYSGNRKSLIQFESKYKKRLRFERGDISDSRRFQSVVKKYDVDAVIHLAAETHVDRSILDPAKFIQTNIVGTFRMLEVLKTQWKKREDVIFHHVSTDEVYGSLEGSGAFVESSPYSPRNPYSASKAASDHLVSAYFHTYGLPFTMTKSGNNYGPYQHPEKLIPLMISKILDKKPLPVYGDGKNVRDWLFVEDHVRAIWSVVTNAASGSNYNIGGDQPLENIQVVHAICKAVADALSISIDEVLPLIRNVKDRLGHDKRYAIDSTKIKNDLGWCPQVSFQEGIRKTVDWYLENKTWTEKIRSNEYKNWMKQNYQETK